MHILAIAPLRVCSGPQQTRSFSSDLATERKFNNSGFMAIEFLHHQAQHLDDQEAGETHGLRPQYQAGFLKLLFGYLVCAMSIHNYNSFTRGIHRKQCKALLEDYFGHG